MKILYRPLILTIFSTILSCGSNREFDNPADPESKSHVTYSDTTTGTSSGGSTNGASPENTTTGNGSGAGSPTGTETSAGTNTITASAPAGSTYNFANSFSVTPSGCTDVKGVKVFENLTGILIFVAANCGARTHVYSYKASFAGVAETAPLLVTNSCNAGSVGVKYFDVDKSDDSYILSYVCQSAASTFTTYAVTIDSSGSAGTAQTIESSQDKNYNVVWNDLAGVFGLIREGRFQRINKSAIAVGGPIGIGGNQNLNFQISDAKVFSGSWKIFHFYENSPPIMSVVSSQGSLTCNAAFINPANDYSAGYFSLNETSVLSSNSSYGINRQSQSISNCSISNNELSNNLRPSNQVNAPYQTLAISSSIGAILYKTTSSLILATIPVTDSFKIYGESSIAGFTNLTNATARVIGNKVYVSYSKDGAGYVSYSNESVP